MQERAGDKGFGLGESREKEISGQVSNSTDFAV